MTIVCAFVNYCTSISIGDSPNSSAVTDTARKPLWQDSSASCHPKVFNGMTINVSPFSYGMGSQKTKLFPDPVAEIETKLFCLSVPELSHSAIGKVSDQNESCSHPEAALLCKVVVALELVACSSGIRGHVKVEDAVFPFVDDYGRNGHSIMFRQDNK